LYTILHPKADIDRLYVKRKERGGGEGGALQTERKDKAGIMLQNIGTQHIKKTSF
jgi:hypothetical protein